MRRELFRLSVFLLPFALLATLDASQVIVAKHRAKYPTPLGPENAVKLLRDVAGEVRGGLLRKESGAHCGGFACDIVCFADGKHFDILRDAEGAADPQWTFVGQIDPARCELVSAAPLPPSPSPPSPPAGDLLDELRAIRGLLDQLARHLGMR